MANTEDIEAKLCAFVDGELDAAGISEIERHLAANPQHRRLIQDLMETRSFVRDLPRAVAPADVIETLHSQLERSALLGEDARDGADVVLRIGHWQQLRAIAAVLVLAVGLAAILYYMLPSPQQPGTEIAFKPSPTQPSAADARGGGAETSATSTVIVSDGSPDAMTINPSPSVPLIAGGIPAPQATVSNARSPHDLLLQQVLQNAGALGKTKQAPTLVVQIDTFEPQRALTQVRDHLAGSLIRFDERPSEQAPIPLDLKQSQIAWTTKHRQQVVTPERAIEPVEGPVQEQTQQLAQAGGAARPDDQIGIARQMSRPEIEAMCAVLSDPTIGQHARLVDQHAAADLALQFTLGHPAKTDRSGSAGRMELTLVESTERDGPPSGLEVPGLPTGFAMSFPTTVPSHDQSASLADERTDVMIVVRTRTPPTTAPAEPR